MISTTLQNLTEYQTIQSPQEPTVPTKVPSYSLWRRQMTSKQERSENYPHPFGSSASYYTSDSAKALIYQQDNGQSSYRLDNIVRDSEHNYKSEKTTIKRKTVSTTISNSISGRPQLARKSSHRKSTKRRNKVVAGGAASKNLNDSNVSIKSSLKKQSSHGVESGHMVTQKVSMAQVTRQVSIKRRKSMRRKHSEYKSGANKRQTGPTSSRGSYYTSKELSSIDEKDRESHSAASNTNKSKTSSTLKSCRSMSEFETLPPPTKCQENSKGNDLTNKLSSILTNGNSSRTTRRSKPKHLHEEYKEHTEDGLFINKEMFNRDKEYEES